MLYVLYNMAYTAFAIPFGKLSDRIGRIKILIFGAFIFAVVCGSIILASSLIAFIFIFLLYGLVYAIMIGNQRAFVSDLSPNNMRATALGAFQTITGISSIIAGVLAGWLFDINSSLLFFYGLILSIGYIAVIISFRHSLKKVN
jgi:MFS family permease